MREGLNESGDRAVLISEERSAEPHVRSRDKEGTLSEAALDSSVDAQLVARVKAGDQRAYETLVRRHLGAALVVARSRLNVPSDAEDVCQEAFMSALKNIDTCRNPARFRSWLLTIVKNRAHNKREYEAIREHEPLEGTSVRTPPDVERTLELHELRRDIEAALGHLTELQRRVMTLHDMEGWAHSEIAQRLKISNGSSRVHLHAARKRMRKQLGAEYGDRMEYRENGS